MKLLSILKASCLFLCMSISFTIHAEKKVALIIGNENYSDENFDNLRTCINDANLINNVLSSLGYSTNLATNCTQSDVANMLTKFDAASKGADVAIFFFSGHAKNIGGELYLVPSNTKFKSTAQRSQFISLSDVKDIMESNSKLSLLFIDACRDGARTTVKGTLKSGKKSPQGALPANGAPYGWMICYATQNGERATIGDGTVSPFTSMLAKHLTDGNEFRTVWKNIKDEVTAIAPGQYPDEENFYENSFYFCPVGEKKVAPEITPITKPEQYKYITINCDIPSARVNIYGSTFDIGKPIPLKKGQDYTFSIEVPGYQKYVGVIKVNNSPSSINVSLVKAERATLYVSANTKAEVYIDKKFVGIYVPGRTFGIETISGLHDIKLTAKGFYDCNETIDLVAGRNNKVFNLPRDYPDFWEWDGYDGQQSLRYHFSPKYQIGLSYMYKPEETRFSFGLFLAASPGWFKGLSIVDATSSVYVGSSSTITVDDGNGNPIVYKSTTTQEEPERYSPEIDPNNEAKKYEANSMALANVGFNITNGISVEAGFGVAYHQDRYYMSNVNYLRTTTLTNEATGEIVGEPKIECVPQGFSQWFKQDTKWSPALRLGANGLIPLDGWDKYFISFGAGYTFLFTNNKFSSWDANIGFVWKF